MIFVDTSKKTHYFYLIIFSLILVWSLIKPNDIKTWFLEVIPILAGLIFILITYNSFRLTNLSYMLLTIAGTLVLIGGHYTYGEEPFFNSLKDVYHLSRNYYDRFGHIVFGFTTAIIIREFLIRKSPLTKGKLLSLIILCISLSISALYEILEWIVGLITGKSSRYFIGMQGDIWDTQIDMALFAVGAVFSLILLGKLHDRYLKNIN